MKGEYILCAAIHYDDDKVHPHQPKNIKQGFVICGRRHHNCFAIMGSLLGIGNYDKNKIVQGFVTSLDRYVDRKEGLVIAMAAKQIRKQKQTPEDVLISEDLY